jgi:uncharacterized protein YdaT
MFFGEKKSKANDDEILQQTEELKKKLHSFRRETEEKEKLLEELSAVVGDKKYKEKIFQDTPQESEPQENEAAVGLEMFLQSKEGKIALERLKKFGKNIFIAEVLGGCPEEDWTGWTHNYYLGPNGLYREDIYEENYDGDITYVTPTKMFEDIKNEENTVTSKIYSSEVNFIECLKNKINDALHEESFKKRKTADQERAKDKSKYSEEEEFEQFQKKKKIYEGIIRTSEAKSERDQARKLYKLMTGREYDGPEYQEKQ